MSTPNRRSRPSPPTDSREALFAAERAVMHDAAMYIAEVTAELKEMADNANLSLLAQFLAMARLEAEMQARMHAGADPEEPAA